MLHLMWMERLLKKNAGHENSMEWMNISGSTMDSEAFLDATDAQQARWLRLLRFCTGQENGGVIVGAAAIDDRKFGRLAGVTMAELQEVCSLWHFEQRDLVIHFYPLSQENERKAKQMAGQKGGLAKARNDLKRAASQQSPSTATSSPPDTLPSTPPSTSPTERKGKEGKKGKVREEEGNARAQEDSEIPSLNEFCGAFMADGIPQEYLASQFKYFSEKRTWINSYGNLVDWRLTVRNRWATDRATFSPHGVRTGFSEKNATRPQSIASLKFELDKMLTAVQQRLDDAYSLNLPPADADVALERDLKKRRAALVEDAISK